MSLIKTNRISLFKLENKHSVVNSCVQIEYRVEKNNLTFKQCFLNLLSNTECKKKHLIIYKLIFEHKIEKQTKQLYF